MNLPRRIGIRWALFALFTAFVLGGGAISIFLSYRMTSEAVIGEAQRRVELDLRSAWAQYKQETDRVQNLVALVSLLQKTQSLLTKKDMDVEWARNRLEEIRKKYNLDILTITDANGKVVLRTRYPYSSEDMAYQDPVFSKALKKQPGFGTVLIPPEVLEKEGEHLKEQAYMDIEETPLAVPTTKKAETSGMMIKAAEPVYDDANRFIGIVYGGVLLNRNYRIPDAIRDTIFHNEQYGNKPLGTVTIFQWDLRISTNVMKESGTRAIGTRVSRAVYDMTLQKGLSYYDRAFVVNGWYLTAYDPISDPDDNVIGILYVGIQEQKYLDYKNRLTRSLLEMVLLGTVLALILSFTFATWLSRPIRRLIQTASAIAQGNFDVRVQGGAPFMELQRLNEVFNTMADAVVARSDALSKANADLTKSNEELTQINQNYMDVLEFVSHELKSPLASMIFGLNTLKEGYLGGLNQDQVRIINTIEKSAEYLNEMILNYLNLSRIEKDELIFEPAVVPMLKEVIEPVTVQCQQQVESNKMWVLVDVPAEIRVLGDINLLKIVMDNLLSNAAKYGRPGTAIRINYEGVIDDRHRFSVSNQGEGIPEKDLAKLFKKFSRLNMTELRMKNGTGLGLFITREIIQKHKGDIRAESKEGEWVKFIFDLPQTTS